MVSKRDLKRFKEMLNEQRVDVLGNARRTRSEEAAFDTDDLPDEFDLANSESAQSLTFRLRDREKWLLGKIDKAIKKIDEGDFGICEDCGEDISTKRLEARPVTPLCIRCKEEQEKVEKSYS